MRRTLMFLLVTLCILTSIPLVSALETVTDTFDNSSKIASSTQIAITGGNAQLDTYPVSIGLAGFASCRKLTIDAGDIDADLVNFPILVHLNSSNIDWSKVQDDLDDLRFTQDNATLLMAELDNYVVNSEAWIWVKIPAIDDAVNTELFLYYNNATCSSYWNAEAVWDANYVMVQHLNDATTSTVLDSTSNSNDGVKVSSNNPLLTSSGKIGNAQDFVINNKITVNDADKLDITDTWSVFGWFKTSQVVAYAMLVSKWGGTPQTGYELYLQNGLLCAHLKDNAGVIAQKESALFTVNNDIWHYVGFTFDRTWLKLYGDGNVIFSVNSTLVDGSFGNPISVTIATRNTAFPFIGLSDEICISNNARSSAWILASYETQRLHLVSYSAEENAGNVYYDAGYFQSVNLLSGLNVTEIVSLSYNCTIDGTESITLQFSQNTVTWFNTTDVDGFHVLTNGTDTINLKVLGWVGGFFYYRCNMSDTTTPQLHSLSVEYSTSKPSSYTSFVFILVIVALVIGILALGSRKNA